MVDLHEKLADKEASKGDYFKSLKHLNKCLNILKKEENINKGGLESNRDEKEKIRNKLTKITLKIAKTHIKDQNYSKPIKFLTPFMNDASK